MKARFSALSAAATERAFAARAAEQARRAACFDELVAALADLVAADDSDRSDGSQQRMYMLGSPRDHKWKAARAAIANAKGKKE